jgi:general secretion pathway protein N
MTRTSRCVVCVLLGTFWVAIPALGIASPNLNYQLDPGGLDVGAPPRLAPHPKSEPDTAAPAPNAVANPLWAVPLKSLSATRERPLFTPSRRPPAAALASTPAAPAPTPPPSPAVEHPTLTLVGTVHRDNLSIAVFTEPSTHATVRLHTGEGHMGWILNSVERNSVILQKGAQTETLALPRTVTAQAEPAASAGSGAATPVTWVMPVPPNSAGRRP